MARRGVGGLTKRFAFDPPAEQDKSPTGSVKAGWDTDNAIVRDARMMHSRSKETDQAGKLTGSSKFKIKIQQSVAARAITPDYRMRDARSGTEYQIRKVDSETNDTWIWIDAEGGVAI